MALVAAVGGSGSVFGNSNPNPIGTSFWGTGDALRIRYRRTATITKRPL